MLQDMWSRAVWLEREREEEGVVPSNWVTDDYVNWPSGCDATRAMAEQKNPGANWRKFKLVKVKLRSGNCLSHLITYK